jgi:hypothetical protein
MSNDLDVLTNMDPEALAKDDAALLKIIEYYRRLRGLTEEGGKNTSTKPTIDGKAGLQELGLITGPKPMKRRF